jgi:hypothetical protein
MDFITSRFGLPPILKRNMDEDYSVPAAQRYNDAVQGARESLRIMTECLDRYEREGYVRLQGTLCGME